MLALWYIWLGYTEYKPDNSKGNENVPKKPEPAEEPTPVPKPHQNTKQIEESPKEVETPKIPEPPKSVETPKQPELPKKVETTKLPEPPKNVEPSKLPEPPKKVEPPKLPEPPKKVETPKFPEPPKKVETTKLPEPPKKVETPKFPEPPKKVETPKLPEPPKRVEMPSAPSKLPEPLKPSFPGKPRAEELFLAAERTFGGNNPPSKPVQQVNLMKNFKITTPETSDDEELISEIDMDDESEESEDEGQTKFARFSSMRFLTQTRNILALNFSRGKDKMVDAAVLDKLEAGFKKLEASDSKSLLKKYLTREVFDRLKNLKTPSFGSTLLDVVQSGFENHDSGVGIYAPDAEAYTVFADLFDPIIEDYHGGFKKTDKHPAKDWGDVDSLGNLDPTGEYVISTRVRCGRSMEGYPFNPCLTEAQYKEMEEKVSSTLSGLTDELKGTYYPLTGMTKEVQQKLIDDHFLFKEGDRFLQAANACRFWPSGRGIYHNDNKTFLVWCNEEDHLRLISMQMGGDLGQVYRRLVTAVNDVEKRVPFSHNDRLGFLTFCPSNLGTTVRASVHIKVPKLAANKAKLEEVAAKFNLQVRGTRGEHTEAEGGVYDISNKRRMGLTEYQAVKEMHDGIAELIKIEKEL